MTAFDDVAPTAGDQANSFEWIWDVCADPAAVSKVWLNVDRKSVV